MNVQQLRQQQQTKPAEPAKHPVIAWAQKNKGAIAIATALVVGLVIWAKFEGAKDGEGE